METFRLILAWVLVIILSPLWVTIMLTEVIMFMNNDLTKDVEPSYKAARGFATIKLLDWFINKVAGE